MTQTEPGTSPMGALSSLDPGPAAQPVRPEVAARPVGPEVAARPVGPEVAARPVGPEVADPLRSAPYAFKSPDPLGGADLSSGAGRRPLVVLLVVLIGAMVLCAGLSAASSTLPGSDGAGAVWLDGARQANRVPGIQALLDRRADAVRARNKDAFLADVDRSDPEFVRKQGITYDNLVQMPFAELAYQAEASTGYSKLIPNRIVDQFQSVVLAPGVTIRYRIDGIDSRVVTTPWVPIVGYVGQRWVIAGEVTGKGVPYGTNSQAWDAGPIWVARSNRVVAVFSSEDASRSAYLLQLAEKGLDRVRAVRPGGWDGSVAVTAVQDQRIFDRYFADAPDRITRVAAIAVPYYDRVPDWRGDAVFATTRVVVNPQQLSAQPEELAHDLAHEFVHAAMGPVTKASTPQWLVEGFAEYVSYKGQNLSSVALRKMLRDVNAGGELPADGSFYSDPKNYPASWMACRMIAERYGEQRLIAFYEAFQKQANQEANVTATLGASMATVTAQWREYLQKARS